MEILDIVDEKGVPTGKTIEREIAHRQGIRHRTAHVWIIRKKGSNIQILLQKRSEEKDSYPGCYDISSAGHIPAGVDFIASALRELKEELGVEVEAQDLIYCGQRHFEFKEIFYGKLFHDNQISNVYILWLDYNEDEFILQKEEVSQVKWFDFNKCVKMVENDIISNCIYIEELDMIKKQLENIKHDREK